MRLLEYADLDISRVRDAYRKASEAIARGDFRSADVKKLAGGNGRLYRAKLDYANRLLLTFVRHGEETCALALEVIEGHAYEKSRFLRGAPLDENKIVAVEPAQAVADAEPLRYLHPERPRVHFLDKALSLDDAQEAIYRLPAPVVIVGGAGSGKTALTLEKLKLAEGETLYVTRSAYLAQTARDLYYANGFERDRQDAQFLSYREFIETLRVPAGREATWRDFAAWFPRMRQTFKGLDAHQAFEEIRGVIAAQADGVMTRAAYGALGVRQSIFEAGERDRLYDLFERYREWLRADGLYDLTLVAQEWRALVQPRYDFIVVDEVQDLTPAELVLILKSLKQSNQFLLCGDSNQIVHPNFFSWSQVKTLFWRDEQLAREQALHVLTANFRNGREATQVANTLLKIKHRRFGSIDRESNFLVQAVGAEQGRVELLPDKDAVKKALDDSTRRSTRFAVLVLRDEDKTEARQYFRTPLVFAIHEAKGLEYDNIVLYRFVSGSRAAFAEIAAGVGADDLTVEELEYRRARDKTDKSLEIHKFYVNALYVALTRAIRNLYVIESDTEHPLLKLLGLSVAEAAAPLAAQSSTQEEWQKEARKLELQGKQEQAEAIRQTILKEAPVPWPVFDEARLRELMVKVFREHAPGGKPRQQLYEYATCHNQPGLARLLAGEGGFDATEGFQSQRAALGRKHYAQYGQKNFKDVLAQCERHGLEHRTPMNQTPLMAAATAGNVALVEALLARGADPEATDDLGRNALHWALAQAFYDPAYARNVLPALYEQIAPAAVDLMTDERAGGRLVRLDRHLTEYFLFQTLWVLFKNSFDDDFSYRVRCGVDTGRILAAWEHLPASVLKPERNKRAHLSNVLSRNEVARDYAYNRRLFVRLSTGWYQLNPKLAIRRRHDGQERWVPLFTALNLPLVYEFTDPAYWHFAQALWQAADNAELAAPIAWENRSPAETEFTPWESPREQREEIERLRLAIEQRTTARAEEPD
jgi:hypothetical protein